MSISPLVWTTKEVGAALRICPKEVRRLVKEGSLPVVRVGRRDKYRPADVYAFMEENRKPGPVDQEIIVISAYESSV